MSGGLAFPRPIEAPAITLGGILLLGLALRLLWAALVPVEPVSDGAAYHLLATNIIEHGVYGFEPGKPSAYWAVGASAIYTLGYLLLPEATAVVTLNLLAALASIALLYELGRRWMDVRTGLVAAGLFALWPLGIQFTTVLASEMFFIVFTLAGLLCWERAREAGGPATRWLVAAGILWAAAVYVRPVGLLVPIVLAAGEAIRRSTGAATAARRAGLTLAVIVLCVSPWTLRNYMAFDAFVPVSTNFGANFWMGSGPGTAGHYRPLPETVDGMTEPERSSFLLGVTIEHIRSDPAAFAALTVRKAALLHDRETIGVVWNGNALEALVGATGVTALKIVSTLFWYAVLAGGLVGAAYLFLKLGPIAILFSTPLLVWGYYTGVYALTVVGDRYHVPSFPFIALLAAAALVTWRDRSATA
jgi:4-amino-4-deoxy-L-arabinose transferase-like glycosyltransferase